MDSERATTSADLRAHNLARLLRAVHDGGGGRTRADLTRQLSLARGTATVLVRDLADRGLIEELQVPADMAARAYHGRYLTGADFDARSRVLLRRAQDAVDAVTSSEVYRAGLLDEGVALAGQEWDIALALHATTTSKHAG